MGGIRVRPVRPDEYREVGELTLAAYDAVGRIEGDYREEMLDTGLRVADGAEVLVAEDPDGRIVGTVTFVDRDNPHFESRETGDCGFRMMAVDPDAWGRGVGRALLRACIERAQRLGRRRVAIYSMEWMPRAHALYRAHGFERRPDRDVRFPSGIGVAFTLDLVPDAAEHFPPPGSVPDVPPWYEDLWGREGNDATGC